MKKLMLATLSAIILLSGCEKQRLYVPNLVEIDSLLKIEQNNAAIKKLKQIDVHTLRDGNLAYYNLLYTIAANHIGDTTASLTRISHSVRYFERTDDVKLLSRALLYQGIVFMEQKKLKEAMLCLKRSETLAKSLNDDTFYIEIGKELAFLNSVVGNYNLSDKYTRTVLEKAKQADDKLSIGYCYHLLTVDFSNRGNRDSSNYYQEKTIPYIDLQPKRDRYKFYFNAATYYWRKGEYGNAETYFRKSLDIKPWELSYGALAELLVEQGRFKETDSLWAKAFATDDKSNKVKMLWAYSKWLWAQNRKQEAWDIAIQIPLLKDSIAHQQQAEELQMVQSGYEQQLTEMHQHSRMQQMVIYCLCIVLVMALAGFLLWRKLQKTRQRLAESQKDTETYTLRIKMEQQEIEKLKHEQRLLENSKKRSEKEHQELESALNRRIKDKERRVKDLQRKLQSLHDEQGTMLAHGKRLYESIIQGGTTEGWRKADYVDFANYYRLDHFDFFEENSSLWDSMTPREQFFLILHDMGLEKDQILFTMQISKGAYRTLLSRIANKGE